MDLVREIINVKLKTTKNILTVELNVVVIMRTKVLLKISCLYVDDRFYYSFAFHMFVQFRFFNVCGLVVNIM